VVPARHHSYRDLQLVGSLSQRLVLTSRCLKFTLSQSPTSIRSVPTCNFL
jgi:hypothetical protein